MYLSHLVLLHKLNVIILFFTDFISFNVNAHVCYRFCTF